MDDAQVDGLNDLYATLHARAKDSPAKTFWHAQAMHPAIYRALNIDPAETGAPFASLAFRLHRDEHGARILWAYPTPMFYGDAPDDWLGIETVLAWYPHLNRVEVIGDIGPRIIGPISEGTAIIFADPFAFFRAHAEARAQWFANMIEASEWRAFHEIDLTPGALVIGDIDKLHWPVRSMPVDIICHGIDPAKLNRTLLKQARIPRARASQNYEMKAA